MRRRHLPDYTILRFARIFVIAALAFVPMSQSELLTAEELSEEEKRSSKVSTSLKLDVYALRGDKSPVAGATIRVSNGLGGAEEYTTDNQGKAAVTILDVLAQLTISAEADGLVPMKGVWFGTELPKIGKRLDLELATGQPVGGRVVDEDGKPISGAEVSLRLYGSQRRANCSQTGSVKPVYTDDEGYWFYDSAPRDLGFGGVAVKHPLYVALRSTRGLRDGSHRTVMRRARKVSGTITDISGKPVPNARFFVGGRTLPEQASTDQDGKYELACVGGADKSLIVMAPGYSLELETLALTDEQTVNFKLNKALKFSINVVDESGQPVPYVTVRPMSMKSNTSLQRFSEVFPTRTDQNGQYHWEQAPREGMGFSISKPGYDTVTVPQIFSMKGSHQIKLRKAPRITGRVVDRTTGLPIQNFQLFRSRLEFPQSVPVFDPDGRFEIFVDVSPFARETFFNVEADGYLPSEQTKCDRGGDGRHYNFRLRRAKPHEGAVFDSLGKPTIATIYLLKRHETFRYTNLKENAQELPQATSIMDGRFLLPRVAEQSRFEPHYRILAIGDAGFREISLDDFVKKPTITLTPFASIRGALKSDAGPVANQTIRLYSQLDYNLVRPVEFETTTDEVGNFAFDNIPAGFPYVIGRKFVMNEYPGGTTVITSHAQEANPKPGETTSVTLEAYRGQVTGRIETPDNSQRKVEDWNCGFCFLLRERTPAEIENRIRFDEGQRFHFRIEPDGSFQVNHLPAGKYELSVRVHERTSLKAVGRCIGTIQKSLEIPANGEIVDLGSVKLKMLEK